MLAKRVSDLHFGKLTIMYGRTLSYEWIVDDMVLKFSTTRHLTSQLKFRETYLEQAGVMLLRISTEAWAMILNKAFAESNRTTEKELEELWLFRVAQYCIKAASNNQKDIARGAVYETNTGLVFTSRGLLQYLKKFEDIACCTGEWHSDKLLSLLNAKSSSMSLKDFKGRAVKIQKFSCRVDKRFYEYYEGMLKNAEAA